ncbi:MAG: hypothetical protein JJ913_02790 [Rhizobiaceae bacterium]|nr:hypothetical protein [Rhizobiaceae bacterium]
MLELSKIIHFLSFSVGIGGGVANMIIGMAAASAPAGAGPALGQIRGRIGRASAIALLLLWITGIHMVYAVYGGWSGLTPMVWAKLAFVVVLTMAAIGLQTMGIRSVRTGTPPPAGPMAVLGVVALVASVAALVLAVVAFG